MAMNAPPPSIMQEHDPNDDPFADLAQETDLNAPKLASPMEFGMGLKNVKEAAASDGVDEDKTEATHDETEHAPEEEEAEHPAEAEKEESGDKKEEKQAKQ